MYSMTQKHILIYATLLVAIACKKQEVDFQISYRKFDTVTYYSYASDMCLQGTFKANYDGDRLISLTRSGNPDTVIHFIYNSAGQLIQRDLSSAAGREKMTEYIYNGADQLMEEKSFLRLCNNYLYKCTYLYTGDILSGSIVYYQSLLDTGYIFQTRNKFSWLGDNISTVTGYDKNGSSNGTFTLIYDIEKINHLRTFKDFWIQDLYERGLTLFLSLNKNRILRIEAPGTVPCRMDTEIINAFNEERLSSMKMDGCGGELWRFTYTQ